MPSMIQARMASSAEMLAVFGDEALIAHALAFEAALAQAEAECGVIPQGAAEDIAEATRSAIFDAAANDDEPPRGGIRAWPPERPGSTHFGYSASIRATDVLHPRRWKSDGLEAGTSEGAVLAQST
ncbi:hypothetical protein SAMN05444161_8614 [Rhizobiales bacterium GAS191]|nr:hypothetical protein SAMN05444161_8614 [Rhizobiales bacterium GAS191]